jgi:hypothetical protein
MKILQAMSAVPTDCEVPSFEEGASLFEVGLLLVLLRELTEPQARKALRALVRSFEDWNELRVSQPQEFEDHIPSKSRELRLRVAITVKSYLQEVFQKNHGFDLEFLREDRVEAAKFLGQFPFLGAGAAHVVLSQAGLGEVPMSLGIIRVLYRTGSMKRTSSIKKAQAILDPLLAPEDRPNFGLRLGTVVERWCDSKRPICWECPLLDGCPNGKRVHREWTAQQKRLEVQRRRDDERRRKQEERERKRCETLARKRATELARHRRLEEKRRKQVEAKRVVTEKREALLKEAAKKATAEKRKARKVAQRAAQKAAAQKKIQKKIQKKAQGKAQKTVKKPTPKSKTASSSPGKSAPKKTKKTGKSPKASTASSAKPTKPSAKSAKKVTKKPAKKAAKKPTKKAKKTKTSPRTGRE